MFKALLAALALIFLTVNGWAAAPKVSTRDTNGDGKPDVFTEYVKGRALVLREYDKNYDGKIDKRSLMQWQADKRTPIYTDRVTYIATPGYVTLWTEEDKDFDGKIDAYREKGNKNPPRDKIGQPIEKSR